MSVVASVVFGFILLVAVTFAVPSTDGAIDNLGFIVPWIWSESMGQNWAEALLFICVVAQFFCVTASITSASRMLFAFSRDGAVPGHRLWRQVGAEPCAAADRWSRSSLLSAAIMIPAYWNYLVGYLVGTGDRGHRALHRVHPARDPAIPARPSRFVPGAWTLGKHYKWIDAIAILWVVFIVHHLPAAALQVEPRRAETRTPRRFTRTSILWNLPSLVRRGRVADQVIGAGVGDDVLQLLRGLLVLTMARPPVSEASGAAYVAAEGDGAERPRIEDVNGDVAAIGRLQHSRISSRSGCRAGRAGPG